jgi:hypothetical protein
MGISDVMYNALQKLIADILIKTSLGRTKELETFYKNYKDHQINVFSTKPNVLTDITFSRFLAMEKGELDVSEDFVEDPNILPAEAVLTFVISRTDKKHLRANFLKNRFGKGVIGSSKMGNPFKKIGIFQSIKLKTTLSAIDKSNEGLEYDTLFKSKFVGPRDWFKFNSSLFILTHPYLLKIDERGQLEKIQLPGLASPHSVFISKENEIMTITSTGNDLLFSYDLRTKESSVLWSAIESGFHYSIGKESVYLIYKNQKAQEVPKGYKIMRVSRYEDLPTALQVMHINSAIESKDGQVYFTAFATKKVGEDTGNRTYQEGSGGKVFMLDKKGGLSEKLIGLFNPHGLDEININDSRMFALTETSIGTLNFYKGDNFKLLKKINFASVIRRVQNSVNAWLMEVSISYSTNGDIYLSAFSDNDSPGIFILKISKDLKLSRWFVTVPDKWAIQKIIVTNI